MVAKKMSSKKEWTIFPGSTGACGDNLNEPLRSLRRTRLRIDVGLLPAPRLQHVIDGVVFVFLLPASLNP